jgi:predicted nucleic acid-binding protein
MSQLIQRYAIIPLTSEDFETAAHFTQQHPLKAYDAVQLAIALRYHRLLTGSPHPCIFVSGDASLLNAARAEGLSTDNPFDHVVPEDTLRRSV